MAETLSLPASANAVAEDAVREITFVVEDMHCGACIRTVEQALMNVPGVSAARANLSARRVGVRTAWDMPSAEPLIQALAGAGFRASPLASARSDNEGARDRAYLKRLAVAGFAAANIMLLSVSVWSGYGSDMPQSLASLFHWLSAAIALPAVAYAGQPFFSSARRALAAGRLNMDVPISLGVCLATAMSLFQTVRGSEQVYFDAAVSLLFFLLIGRYLDVIVRRKAAGVAQNLLGLQGGEATVLLDNGTSQRLSVDRISPGMRILIATGERVPVDARLQSATASLDDSLITGESLPRQRIAGEPIFAGTINLADPIEAEVTAAAENTLLAELSRLMEAAQQAKSSYVRLADRAARLYAPAVHLLGAGTFLGWLIAGHGWEGSLTAAIAVLIITCPCALALAVPAVQVVATGRLMRRGVIVKAADGLERLSEVDTIVLDKTGTLTLPEPQLSSACAVSDEDLARAAGLAVASRHPYARAVVAAARARHIDFATARDVREVQGAGLEALAEDGVARLGSQTFCGVEIGAVGQGATLWLALPGRTPVALQFEEQIRPDASAVIARLKVAGYSVELLSGDREGPVSKAAEAAGIATWRAGQTPDQKVTRLDTLAKAGHRVLMVGDGLNDAPALAAGHASLSPSTAADISQTTADALFQGVTLDALPEVLDTAKAAKRRALENFAIAVGYNFVFVPMAIAGLVTPLVAAIAMSASSIAVTMNAMRLALQGKEETP